MRAEGSCKSGANRLCLKNLKQEIHLCIRVHGESRGKYTKFSGWNDECPFTQKGATSDMNQGIMCIMLPRGYKQSSNRIIT